MTTRPSRPRSASTTVRRLVVVTLKSPITWPLAPGDRTAAKIEKLLAWLESIKAELGIPKSIREAGVQEADFLAHVDKLSEDAFDDQCTGANPRYPLISELKQILLDTYYGREFVEGEAGAKAEVAPVKAEKKAKKSA
ncbi:alcohol dehydrogenase [Klebsiella pneumoniae]|uniref:Alcohol dehydrogenase n=1 Tax=Klebsiella pneumoniae TaxID=573 RepID=A0A4P0Y8L6_KLEPN|nr:alcohol dehydrogenase [Klebsiella pneumoniae]